MKLIINNIINTKLETKRLALRPVKSKDLRKIFEMRKRYPLSHLMKTIWAMNYTSYVNWFKKKNYIDYIILDKKNKKIIGIICATFYLKNNILSAELDKYIAYKKYQYKELETEATTEWVNFIFQSTKINYFFTQTLKKNFSNLNLNLKLGFSIKKKVADLTPRNSSWNLMKLDRKKWKKNNSPLIRNIYFSDLKEILKWRNNFKVRKISFDKAYISYKKHYEWYKKIQTSKSYFSFLILKKNNKCGIVNFKITKPNVVQWSIYKKPFSKKGIGTYIAYLSINKIFDNLRVNLINASIDTSNLASIRFHESLGFKFKKKLQKNFVFYSLSKTYWEKTKDVIKHKLFYEYNI